MVMRNCIMVPPGCNQSSLGHESVHPPTHTNILPCTHLLHTLSCSHTQLLACCLLHTQLLALLLAHSVACQLSVSHLHARSSLVVQLLALTLSLTSHLHTSCLHSHCPSLVTRTLVARIHCPSLVTCTLVARTLSHSRTINYTDSVADVVHTGSLSFLFHFATPRPAGRLARATPRPGPPSALSQSARNRRCPHRGWCKVRIQPGPARPSPTGAPARPNRGRTPLPSPGSAAGRGRRHLLQLPGAGGFPASSSARPGRARPAGTGALARTLPRNSLGPPPLPPPAIRQLAASWCGAAGCAARGPDRRPGCSPTFSAPCGQLGAAAAAGAGGGMR